MTAAELRKIQKELLELRRQAAIDAARSSLLNFAQYVDPAYDPQWFHRLLANKLEAVARGELTRLIINMPPRHGKSELVSRKFPAYILGRNPDCRLIAAAHTAEFASRLNRDVQRILDSSRYQEVFPGTRLSSHNARSVSGKALRNSDVFEIVDRRGFYMSVGLGGSPTGVGGDGLLIDDPVKSEEEAQSPTLRQRAWDWLTNTFLTRKQTNAFVLLVMTRWHYDDLTGRLLQLQAENPKAEQWELVCLPAIREDDSNPDDPRQIGEALWPDAFPLDALETTQATMGPQGFAGLYQQRPTVVGGAIFPQAKFGFWYRAAAEPPPVLARDADGGLVQCEQHRLQPEAVKWDRQWQSWDMAFKDASGSDYVVGQVQGRLKARGYLLDQVRGRFDFPKTLEQLRTLSAAWPRARAKLIEDKANGSAVIAMARREIPGLIPIQPEGGKEARAHAVTPLVEAGNVYLPHPSEAPWVRELLAELAAFPKGKHDDQVDALTQGLNWGFGRRRVTKIRVAEGAW